MNTKRLVLLALLGLNAALWTPQAYAFGERYSVCRSQQDNHTIVIPGYYCPVGYNFVQAIYR